MPRSPTCIDSLAAAAFAVLLIVCLATQVLGVPVSLWDPEGADDLLESSLLEGFSVQSHFFAGLPFPSSTLMPLWKFSAPQVLLAHSWFHPPPSHDAISC